jgi:hypothetical protein
VGRPVMQLGRIYRDVAVRLDDSAQNDLKMI